MWEKESERKKERRDNEGKKGSRGGGVKAERQEKKGGKAARGRRKTITGLQLLALRTDGRVSDRSEPALERETLTIQLPTDRGTHWYVLKSTEPENEGGRTKSGGSAS